MLYLYMKNGILTAATYVQKGAWEDDDGSTRRCCRGSEP